MLLMKMVILSTSTAMSRVMPSLTKRRRHLRLISLLLLAAQSTKLATLLTVLVLSSAVLLKVISRSLSDTQSMRKVISPTRTATPSSKLRGGSRKRRNATSIQWLDYVSIRRVKCVTGTVTSLADLLLVILATALVSRL